jgi:hypothetical protein
MAALAAGCHASKSPAAAPAPKAYAAAGQDSADQKAVTIEIDNRNYSDMSIYLIHDGFRVLVGSAPGLARTTLSLPAAWRGAGSRLRLLADPIGASAAIATPVLIVAPGEQVYWSIGTSRSSSFASTR